MSKLRPQLFAKPRRQSAVPSTPGKWGKLLKIPSSKIKAAWFDPSTVTIVVEALIEDADWFTSHELYQHTEEDQLDLTRAYYILDGSLCVS